jgi:hypothetical protein
MVTGQMLGVNDPAGILAGSKPLPGNSMLTYGIDQPGR